MRDQQLSFTDVERQKSLDSSMFGFEHSFLSKLIHLYTGKACVSPFQTGFEAGP